MFPVPNIVDSYISIAAQVIVLNEYVVWPDVDMIRWITR